MFQGWPVSRTVLWAMILLSFVVVSGCNSPEKRAQSYYESGLEYVEAAEWVKAGLEFRNALKSKDDFTEARYELGRVEERLGKYESAAKIYYSVAERAPDHFEARIRLAQILLAAGQPDQAEKFADDALAIAPEDTDALVAKAAVELKLGNPEEAVRLANIALETDPNNGDALMVLASERMQAGEPAKALEFLNAGIEENERNLGMQILRLTALNALGDDPAVEGLFVRLTEIFPDTPTFRNGLARWYLQKDRPDDAERTLREYANANPDNEQAQLTLVRFVSTRRGAEAAIAEFKRLLGEDRNDGSRFTYSIALTELEYSSDHKPAALERIAELVANTSEETQKNKARVLYARMLAGEKSWPEALEQVNQVIETDASNADALSVRAAIGLETGKNAEAVDDLIAALNVAPQSANLHQLLASAYERNGKVALAEEHFIKAMTLDKFSPQSSVNLARFLLRYGKNDNAQRMLEEARARGRPNRDVLALLAQIKLNNGDWAGAQELAEATRQLRDGEQTADEIMAAALSGLNRHEESIELLETTLAKSPDSDRALADLIRAYLRAGKQEAAQAELEKRISENPKNLPARILLASVHVAANKTDLAEEALQEAISADSESAVGHTALAQFYSSQNKPVEAEEAAMAGLERDPASAAIRLLLAQTYEKTERYDDAIGEYERLIEIDPNSTIVANNLASLLSERRGDEQSLDRAYEIAERFRNSEVPQFLDTLGWIHYLRGEYAPALSLLKTAADRLPNFGLVHYHLGMTQKQLDQNEQSIASLEKALSLPQTLNESDQQQAQAALEQAKRATQTQ